MNKNKEKKVAPLILEDVVYFQQAEDGSIESVAKNTFYYTFLMEHADDDGDGESNRKAAEDFVCYEELYSYLVELDILGNSKYCLDWTPVGDYGACFTLDLSKVLEDYDLEKLLKDTYQNAHMHKYIDTLVHPVDRLRCSVCGAVTLSRHIEFNYGGEKVTHCLSCYPLELNQLEEIKSVFVDSGYNAIKGVKKRIEVIDEASKVKIADGKTINMLLNEYRERQKVDIEDHRITTIRRILDEYALDQMEAYCSRDFGIIIIDRQKIADFDIFSEAVNLTYEGDSIMFLRNLDNVVYLDHKAIEFIEGLIGHSSIL